MIIDCILLNGRVYEKKDNKGKGLSINVLTDFSDLSSARVIPLFAGQAYIGKYDLSEFKPMEKISLEFEQQIGSQYPKLINILKIK